MPIAFEATTAESKLNTSAALRLQFGREVPVLVRARISYAFRVFAAIYDYTVVENGSRGEAVAELFYGDTQAYPRATATLVIPARYRPEVPSVRTKLRSCRYAGEEIPLAFGCDAKTGNPDWLGEIFFWLSCGAELDVVERDSVGRIPYSRTAFGREGISIRKPYASLLMGWLENHLRNGSGVQQFRKAPSPMPGVEHLVISSHDIDFYYTNARAALLRLLKNVGIAVRLYGSGSFLKSNLEMILKILAGKRAGDYLPALVEELQKANFTSTVFVVAGNHHRRDPNYQLSELAAVIAEADKSGCSVCVHGSYTSVLDGDKLKDEASALEKMLGKKPLGSRQHWLRFDRHQRLFDAVEKSQLLFDSTLGFPDAVGFRNGAAFPFPPYNFREERAYKFLEIPLVLMDGSLEADVRVNGGDAQETADQVLMESRRLGWGGVSVLWHNPIEPLAVPENINKVYWNSAAKQTAYRERWMSAHEFLSCSLSRYQQAGLLEGVQIGA
jgi:hypothetical protein